MNARLIEVALGAFWAFTTVRMVVPIPRILAPYVALGATFGCALLPPLARLSLAGAGVVAVLAAFCSEGETVQITPRGRRVPPLR